VNYINQAKAEAKKYAAMSGHRLGKWQRINPKFSTATCERCGDAWQARVEPDGMLKIGCDTIGVRPCLGK
jgi:hypothetical protein